MRLQLHQWATFPRVFAHRGASREAILAYRDAQLRRVVAHAFAHVPHYRRLFDAAGVRPESIRGYADLPRLPITSKADLQALPEEELLAAGVNARRLYRRTTSGSTGRPFTIRRTWLEERLLNTFRRRAVADQRITRRDHVAQIRLRPIRPPLGTTLPQRALRAFGLYRRTFVSCLDPPEQIARRLAELRPDVVSGYAGVMAEAARAVNEGRAPACRPRLVTAGAEVVTPEMRAAIERAFGAPLRESYGCHEFNLVAWQCAETGLLHTCDDLAAYEVWRGDRPAAPGESGELIGTSLHSYAMPFVRYRLGDVVVRGEEPCPCGAPFGTLRSVRGRVMEYFRLPDGALVHPYAVSACFRDRAEWIRRFQLVQDRPDRVVLRVVAEPPPDEADVARLRAEVAPVLGPDVRFDVEPVDEIALSAGGKFAVARSLVSNPGEPLDWERAADAPTGAPDGGGGVG